MMARVTARQAFTRSRSKRLKEKADTDRSMLEARRRYVRQLSSVGIHVEGGSQSADDQVPASQRRPGRQIRQQSGFKKITDYFAATKSLEFSPKRKQPLRTSVSLDPNGIECVTIYDSDNDSAESHDVNQPTHANDNNQENEKQHENNNDPGTSNANFSSTSDGGTSGFWDTSSESGNSSKSAPASTSSALDIKPLITKLDHSSLGVSFEDLKLKIRVEEDIEVVDILPPIPLRKHEIFDIDGDDEHEQDGSFER